MYVCIYIYIYLYIDIYLYLYIYISIYIYIIQTIGMVLLFIVEYRLTSIHACIHAYAQTFLRTCAR